MSASTVLRPILIAVFAACAFLAYSTARADDAADIAAQNQKWMDLIVKKDAAAIVQVYAEDGAMFPPNEPKAEGREALLASWTGLVAIPGVTLTFKTDKLVFSTDHTMATDIGTYEFGSGDAAQRVVDKGKSVVVWVKRGESWQVLTDMFSSDAPPAKPAAP